MAKTTRRNLKHRTPESEIKLIAPSIDQSVDLIGQETDADCEQKENLIAEAMAERIAEMPDNIIRKFKERIQNLPDRRDYFRDKMRTVLSGVDAIEPADSETPENLQLPPAS